MIRPSTPAPKQTNFNPLKEIGGALAEPDGWLGQWGSVVGDKSAPTQLS